MLLAQNKFVELSPIEMSEVTGGWSLAEWFGAVGSAAGTGATIGSFAGPGGSVVGGISGAVVGNALYFLADYYDKQ